jgi:hypothetical protein
MLVFVNYNNSIMLWLFPFDYRHIGKRDPTALDRGLIPSTENAALAPRASCTGGAACPVARPQSPPS